MKQVSREEFWKIIGPLNVHPRIEGQKYPYISIFMTPGVYGRPGDAKGKIVPNKDSWDSEPKEYFVSVDLVQK